MGPDPVRPASLTYGNVEIWKLIIAAVKGVSIGAASRRRLPVTSGSQPFRSALQSPKWAEDAEFQTTEGRLANVKEMDSNIEAWTSQRNPHQVMRILVSWGAGEGGSEQRRTLLRSPTDRRATWSSVAKGPMPRYLRRSPHTPCCWAEVVLGALADARRTQRLRVPRAVGADRERGRGTNQGQRFFRGVSPVPRMIL